MKKSLCTILFSFIVMTACGKVQVTPDTASAGLKILTAEPFLADITSNIVGGLVEVGSLIPRGIDPHTFEPTPEDVVKIVKYQVLIINGGGLEETWLEKTIANAGGKTTIIEASAGLDFRQPQPGEMYNLETSAHQQAEPGDPHFWLDPNLTIRYVENIRDAISRLDPSHKGYFSTNAKKYIEELKSLDQWIKNEVEQIPPESRLLVTNHESLGYFADRYGFQIIGAIIPSYSSLASPSAKQVSSLVEMIRQKGAKAIFLEVGSNPAIAAQIARETGIKLVDTLNDHTLSGADGPTPNYIEMIRYNVRIIVEALK